MEQRPPVGVYDEGVVVVELLGHQLVLLGSLVLSVVIKAASKPDLGVVMDVASNLMGISLLILLLKCEFTV